MNKWLTILLFLSSALVTCAQKNVFQLDSLPWQGVLLNKNWKFHAGDNALWARPDFDDRHWKEGHPTKEPHTLPLPPNSPIGWFRIKLRIDSSLLNKPLALLVDQNLASEIYLNGKLLKKYGIVSPIKEQVRGHKPYYDAIGFEFKRVDQVIAVRFALQTNLPYINLAPGNPGLLIRINDITGASKYIKYSMRLIKFHYFEAGIFLVLFLIHFLFYLVHNDQKANLFFSIAMIGPFLSSFFATYGVFHSVPLSLKMYSLLVYGFFGVTLYNTFLFVAIHTLLSARRGVYFWILTVFSGSGTFLMLISYQWGFPLCLISLFINTFILIGLALQALRKSIKGFKIITVGLISYCILLTGFTLIANGLLPNFSLNNSYSLMDVLFHTSALGLPICISAYLSREYALTSKSLKMQLLEVKKLSEAKENDLLRQNAELQAALLQGQTTERKRVAADLHDNLGSTLSSLRWSLSAIDKNKLNPQEQEVYQHVQNSIEQSYDQVRLLSHNLLPEELEKQGLWVALEQLVRKLNKNTPVTFSLQLPENHKRLEAKTEFELYSICLELINNILKHAQATEAGLKVEVKDKTLQLTIMDNGKGITEQDSNGKGMRNIAERVKSLRGVWNVTSANGKGTVNEIALS